jgi:hypothetical protein
LTKNDTNWKDIPKEAKNKAQPFLLEDTMGTDEKNPAAWFELF